LATVAGDDCHDNAPGPFAPVRLRLALLTGTSSWMRRVAESIAFGDDRDASRGTWLGFDAAFELDPAGSVVELACSQVL
jgi:hypothetical protein